MGFTTTSGPEPVGSWLLGCFARRHGARGRGPRFALVSGALLLGLACCPAALASWDPTQKLVELAEEMRGRYSEDAIQDVLLESLEEPTRKIPSRAEFEKELRKREAREARKWRRREHILHQRAAVGESLEGVKSSAPGVGLREARAVEDAMVTSIDAPRLFDRLCRVLRPKLCSAVHLRFLEDRTFRDIAEEFGEKPATVRQWFSRDLPRAAERALAEVGPVAAKRPSRLLALLGGLGAAGAAAGSAASELEEED